MGYLLGCLRGRERERPAAFISLGLLAVAVGPAIKKYLPKIMEVIKASLPTKVCVPDLITQLLPFIFSFLLCFLCCGYYTCVVPGSHDTNILITYPVTMSREWSVSPFPLWNWFFMYVILFMHVENSISLCHMPPLTHTRWHLKLLKKKMSLLIINTNLVLVFTFFTVTLPPAGLTSSHQFPHYTISNPSMMKTCCSLELSICIGETKKSWEAHRNC